MRILNLFLQSPSKMFIAVVDGWPVVSYCMVCRLKGHRLCCVCKKRGRLLPKEVLKEYENEVLCNRY